MYALRKVSPPRRETKTHWQWQHRAKAVTNTFFTEWILGYILRTNTRDITRLLECGSFIKFTTCEYKTWKTRMMRMHMHTFSKSFYPRNMHNMRYNDKQYNTQYTHQQRVSKLAGVLVRSCKPANHLKKLDVIADVEEYAKPVCTRWFCLRVAHMEHRKYYKSFAITTFLLYGAECTYVLDANNRSRPSFPHEFCAYKRVLRGPSSLKNRYTLRAAIVECMYKICTCEYSMFISAH